MRNRLHNAWRTIRTPVTVMLVPHSSNGTMMFRVPALVLLTLITFSFFGMIYVYSIVDDALSYGPTKEELDYYKGQFVELKSTIVSLQSSEKEFKQLFALGSREDVLESMNDSDIGSIDMDILRKQINETIDRVGEVRDYLSEARDLYRATPMGWPVKGDLTSGYGYRIHPTMNIRDFHSGMDISSRPGKPVRATADGIVSYSGRNGANGNLIAVEHGFGYTTYYAHNKRNLVKVGDVVKRGDVISLLGSTGRSTGPHLHYEVWKNGHSDNPVSYVKGGNW